MVARLKQIRHERYVLPYLYNASANFREIYIYFLQKRIINNALCSYLLRADCILWRHKKWRLRGWRQVRYDECHVNSHSLTSDLLLFFREDALVLDIFCLSVQSVYGNSRNIADVKTFSTSEILTCVKFKNGKSDEHENRSCNYWPYSSLTAVSF